MNPLYRLFHQFGSPKFFYRYSSWLLPWLGVLCAACFSYGLISGLLFAPADYQQGNGFRIIYFHVPAAFLSMSVYMLMAIASAVGLIWRIKLSFWVAKAAAPIGASFTFITLVTGSIWAKPMWGAWWVWDARLTSELILLFLYLGFIGLYHAIENTEKAQKAAGLLAIVGSINIPIIHFSVDLWYTIHQGPTLSKFAKPSIHPDMLWPLLSMIAAFFLFFTVILMLNVRKQIIQNEYKTEWLRKLLEQSKHAIS